MKSQAEPGTYVLVIALAAPMRLQIGGLGGHDFSAGYYLYVGSALNGWRSRVARHLRKEKRLHWHIDYLLQEATVVEVWRHSGPERLECAWAKTLARSEQMERVVKGFGASDCRCGGHLFYSAERPSICLIQDKGAALTPLSATCTGERRESLDVTMAGTMASLP